MTTMSDNKNAASDDDSSASSSASDDYALNFDIFSPQSLAATFDHKEDEKDNDANNNNNNNEATVNHDLQIVTEDPPTSSTDDADDAKSSIEEKARKVANSIAIDKRISSPRNLFWLTTQKTRSKTKAIHPVRIPPDDSEYIGYKAVLRVKDPSRQCVVQYLQFPHVQITSNAYINKYEVVARSRLVPYHGKRSEDDDHERRPWCPVLSEAYFKQLKREYKTVGDVQIRTEELYLDRVLERAWEEMDDKVSLEQYNVMAPREDSQEMNVVANEEEQKHESNHCNTHNDDSDQENNHGLRRSKRTWNQLDDSNTEWLHCGDVIRFYKPGFAAGDARFLCEATVLAIRPREDPSLVVDCEGEWYMVIPNDHPVMRIKRMERGGLVENGGCCYRPVENYTLKREGGENAVKEVIEKRVRRVKEITERNKRLAIEKIERDGWGPSDIFR